MAEKKYMSLERLQEYDALLKQEIDGKADSSHNHSGSNITSGTVAAARLPVASNSASGIVNTSSQTFAGAKTFSGVITASSGITTGGSIISDTANTDDIGSGSIPFDVTYTRTLNVSPKSVSGSIILGGSFGTTTEGTTTTNGFTELKVGNAKASGTDGNSQGLVQLYNSSTGSVTLQCGHSTSSDYRVYLPSGGGTLALNSTFVKSGSGAKSGLVPAPSTTAGTTKYLREDGTWAVPPDTNTTYTLSSFGITATADELNYTDGVTSNIQTQLNKKANDFSIEIYNGTSGNPKPVKFATVNYSTCGSENGVAIKLSMVSGHGNGTSYAFLQDAIIRVGYTGNVEVDNFKYYGAAVTDSGVARQYGDIFWTIDTTNKIVDFYCLMGQYARLQMTPYKRVTYSTGGTITQPTSCTVYSSGTKVWGNNSDIALMSDLNSLATRLSVLESSIVAVHSGVDAPISTLGEDGDIYLMTEE